ncbi:MAG: hypothetical protein V2J51_16175 [Erythrobacter sp.]|jgi:uncharacterized membrane protein|nr:hypothetical protein [Erythrobacter sp.]
MIARKPATAALAAAMALTATASFAAEAPAGSRGTAIGVDDTVHCYGVNACKGTADCATTEHACKGQNECAGHGFKALKAGECLQLGGTIGDIG